MLKTVSFRAIVILGLLGAFLSNPVASEEWKHTTGFYTLARSGDTLMKLVINGGSTMNVVAQSTIKQSL